VTDNPVGPRKNRWMISLVSTCFFAGLLVYAVDWRASIRMLQTGHSASPLLLFVVAVAGMALVFGYRWRLLVGPALTFEAAMVGSLLCLGGNMLLPARGGDLIRAQHSRNATGKPYSEIFSKVIVEKVIDLGSIVAIGTAALLLRYDATTSRYLDLLLAVLATAMLGLSCVVIGLRYFRGPAIKALRAVATAVRLRPFTEAHIIPLLGDAGASFSVSNLAWPILVTLAMWLLLYAPSYMAVGAFVGVNMDYTEALFVLFAGAIGLMIPAAPSGIGTFHTSIVSAFVFLGRPASEGLLLATAIHLLFLIVCALPASALLWRWHFAPAWQRAPG
jgi:glycosyltransferase 2 family protein